MRTTPHILVALTLLALVIPPVYADEPTTAPIELKAVAGFDGQAKMGHWLPVVLTLKNNGANFDGVIQVESKRSDMGNTEPMTTIYQTPVVLVAGSSKRVQLYLPPDTRSPAIALVQANKQVAVVQPQLDFTFNVLLGVLGAQPADLKALGGLKVGDRTLHMIPLDAATFPTEPLALENLDAILLTRFTYNELPDAQRQALQAWVEHGGTLIAAGGPEAKGLAGMAPWAPLTVQPVKTVSVPQVGETALALLPGDSPFEVSVRRGDLPLVATYHKGSGYIRYLTFDPGLEPMASWAGLPTLVAGLLPPVVTMPNGMGMPKEQAQLQLQGQLYQFPMPELPSTKRLLYLIGGYALVIGPLQFLLLRGFKRTAWAVLTLPVLIVSGSGGAWLYAQQAKLSDVTVNALAVVVGQPDGSSLRVQQLTSFFMPPGSTHMAGVGGALLVGLPNMKFGPPDGNKSPSATKMTLVGGRTAQLAGADDWAMRIVAAEALVPTSGTVAGTVEIGGGNAVGRLTNRLPFTLRKAVVVGPGSFKQIDDLKPGDAIDLAMGMGGASPNGGQNMLMEAMNQVLQPGGNGWGPNGPSKEQFEQMRRQQIVYAGASSLPWATSSDRPALMIAGWAETEALPVRIDGRLVATQALTLYVQPLITTMTKGDFTLPVGFLSPRVVTVGGPAGAQQAQLGNWNVGKGNAITVEFTVPPTLRGRVTDLEVRLQIMAKGPTANPVQQSLFRWADATWQEVPVTNLAAVVNDGARFVSPDGLVRVRLTQTAEIQGAFGMPQLGLSGGGVRP